MTYSQMLDLWARAYRFQQAATSPEGYQYWRKVQQRFHGAMQQYWERTV